MFPSREDFINFYQNPIFDLGMREDNSLAGAFYLQKDKEQKTWDKDALEAGWRLGKSGIADIGEINDPDPFFLNLASTPSSHKESMWMLLILDPTQLAIDLTEKYRLEDDGPFNPEFFKELCKIFEKAGVGFDVPCPYVSNWENMGKYPWPYPSTTRGE